MRLGLDVGSTTLKCAILDEDSNIIYQRYRRHGAQIREMLGAMLREIAEAMPETRRFAVSISGSAGMGLAEQLGLPFVQEVYATRRALQLRVPDADAAIELGGEDAKILLLRDINGNPALEARMNGSCAGGTGAFIDQMATLLNVTTEELNELAKSHERLYTVASRCGVFAKSDIQPLLNQGAKKADVAASILEAVVNQTIAGLAQGRRIEGKVVYLGGPLTFLSELRNAFDRVIGRGLCPDDSLYFVALGAALSGGQDEDIRDLERRVAVCGARDGYLACKPLFSSDAEYAAFAARHARSGDVPRAPEGEKYTGRAYIGVDAGSTTVKAVAIDELGRVLLSDYAPSGGTPVPRVKAFFDQFYQKFPDATLAGCAATGYGEEMIVRAFRLDLGVVETMAHFTAAKAFRPDVDFIIDIGGQDIKCFKIRNGAIDNIYLNEACSSGCGSFLQTFAGAWGLSSEEFAQKGIRADRPVDLGSRCTVFMNSSVKQAQKDGASIENISAGLSISVVKNALYKVIRATSADSLGTKIVVQGGTFLNDAVLRAFEQEMGRDVVRPAMAGLMGAYGAALMVKNKGLARTTALTPIELAVFGWTTKTMTCQGCTNHCALTVNTFGEGRRYISGNRCEKPLGGHKAGEALNLYEEKRRMLAAYQPGGGKRGRIGIPLGLNFYELLPFWHTLLSKLGFDVITSKPSTRETYLRGQYTIPSDTVCYPAKLMHGHVEELLKAGVDAIFYPCMTYNFDEHKGDNHYNCPVVAYYPEVIRGNVPAGDVKFICDYVGPHRKRDFPARFTEVIGRYFEGITEREVREAADAAYAAYDDYMARVRAAGQAIMAKAKERGMPVVILAGRPYHIDGEICHGIDRLLCELGAAVISEDAVSDRVAKFGTRVLNQWTYHARLYAAAKYVVQLDDPSVNLVQLVSFGCGVDAITGDETRAILEDAGRVYTQIKIDEIANLGAARIRLRSLFAATGGETKP